jgi:hypothetical protein
MGMHRFAIALSLLLALTAAASNDLSGVVMDDAGSKPLAGAHVYVYTASPKMGKSPICPSCYRDCGKNEAVDAEGAFRIASLDPTLVFDLLAVADGYEPAFARKIDPKSGSVTIRLKPRSSADANRLITGTVVDPEGKPVIGAIVEPQGYRIGNRVGYGNIGGVDKLSITNARGEFALLVPDASARLDVRVAARSLAPRIDRKLAPGLPRRIALTPGATISGRVLRDGQPVAGLPVQFQQQNRAAETYLGRFEIATNDDGLFVMTNLAPDQTYIVSAPFDGGVIEPKFVKTGADETSAEAGVLTVERGRRVAGRIVPPEGMPLPSKMQVSLVVSSFGVGYTSDLGADGSFVFAAVPKGNATLYVPMGDVKVSSRSPWFDPREEEIVIPAEGDCTDLHVVLSTQ